MTALLIDTSEDLASWTERGVLAAWFGPLFSTVDDLNLRAVALSAADCGTRALAADAVILTGSARDADSLEPAVVELLTTLRELAARDVPVLGICFGHQVLARALGGRVGRNPSGWEVGNVRVSLTEAGLACPILTGLETEPEVLQSHQDAVLELPPGGVLLAGNAHTPVQAFQSRAGGRQFGVQFHPEFTPERLQQNWRERRERWRGHTGFDLDAALDGARATPQTGGLLRRFLDLWCAPSAGRCS